MPFCPESDLSGVGHKDFMHAVWYRRAMTPPADWAGRETVIHFGAVDYDATVWAISERTGGLPVEIGRHRGGFTPFSCNLLGVAGGGEAVTVVVRARDTARAPQPRGKQVTTLHPAGCHYTRTTGIWQTVWLESLPLPAALKRTCITPNLGAGSLTVEQPLTNNARGYRLRAVLSDDAGTVCESEVRADLDFAPRLELAISERRRRRWSPEDPFLYDLEITLVDAGGVVADRVLSYAGLRSVAIAGQAMLLNGEPIFQRLVLDQGYYPDGVMIAPTDDALIRDIQLSLDAGFNGARLHQKVFEERFLYHADRMGYLVWGEFADWGCGGYGPNSDHQQPGITYAAQWLEALERDYSHPCIVGWCPLNETWQPFHDRVTTLDDATQALFLAAKAADKTRPILDTSGYSHRVRDTDVYDSHDYIKEKDFATGLEKFRARHVAGPDWAAFTNPRTPTGSSASTVARWSTPYRGQPYFVSEFGGFRWEAGAAAKSATENTLDRKSSWGYGADPQTLDEFYYRFEATCHILINNAHMFGYCYTQLTDVYPEENGLHTFGREPKFDTARLKAIQSRELSRK